MYYVCAQCWACGIVTSSVESLRCYNENEDLFAEALAKDLRKPRQEAVMFEVKNHCTFLPLLSKLTCLYLG